MEAHTFLIQLVLILFSARVVGEIAAYFNAPSVLGELVAGVLIGPSVFGLIDISPPINLLAQIGIILLLFEVGIETDIGRLSSSGIKAFVVATGGVVSPFILGFCCSYFLLDLSMLVSLFVGGTLTATSLGITLRVLRDLKKQSSHEAQIILGAAVLDDIIGIIILAMLYEFSQIGTVDLWNALKILTYIMLFFLISPIVAKCIAMTIKKWDEKCDIAGLIPTTIVSLILLSAWIAHKLGAPEILGGFTVGLALSRKFFFPFAAFLRETPDFNQQVEEQMKPIVNLLTPIFFVVIGLSIDLKAIDWGSSSIWMMTILLLIAGVTGKLTSGFLLTKETFSSKLIIGTAMVPRGELGLIFANIGLTAGMFKEDIYTSIILVIALTTLLAPFALRQIFTSRKI